MMNLQPYLSRLCAAFPKNKRRLIWASVLLYLIVCKYLLSSLDDVVFMTWLT